MSHWLDTLVALGDEPVVLVTVADAKGSTPREVGAKMLVTGTAGVGTIGGGHLEYKATELAHELLAAGTYGHATLRRFPLGPSLGQCCGGVAVLSFDLVPVPRPVWVEFILELHRTGRPVVMVSRTDGVLPDRLVVTPDTYHGGLGDQEFERQAITIARGHLDTGAGAAYRVTGAANIGLLFEPVVPSDFNIVLFGAGHVAKALVRALRGLPCRVTWIDSRAEQFPANLPANARKVRSDAPEYEVDEAAPGSYFLVMTHSHPLDQSICERVLQRADQAYLGLIGSRSKRRRFEKRFRAQGISEQVLERLICPIGIDGITGKQPAEIAIAVVAQLLRERERIPHVPIREASSAL